MSVARCFSAVLLGVNAHVVEVEAHLSSGLPGFSIVGLPDAAMNESRDRVRAAVVNSAGRWPQLRITVGLSPAWLPKRGSGLDVAIALAILAADGQVDLAPVAELLALGELSLDGRIRPVAGAVATALALVQRGEPEHLVVAGTQAGALDQVHGLRVSAVNSLAELVNQFGGELREPTAPIPSPDAGEHEVRAQQEHEQVGDLSEVNGHRFGKWALEVAAVGGQNVALIGRAGVGKTLLAERLVGILPDLDAQSALEATATAQAAQQGRTVVGQLVRRPPLVAPHHTASRMAIVGGGTEDRPTVGAVTRAHRGVLLLDEAAEFEPSALDSLREPLESGVVRVTRAGFHLSFPAKFQLVLATNPCPCGNALDSQLRARCSCTPTQRRKYLARLSGPLMDRIDIRVQLERPSAAELVEPAETSQVVRARVEAARAVLADRLRTCEARTVAEVSIGEFNQHFQLPPDRAAHLRRRAVNESLRGVDRIARLAWTLAAIGQRDIPSLADIDDAHGLRGDLFGVAA